MCVASCYEEVLGGVGVSNGLSSVVQFHHIGTEDVHVVLALEEQSLRAPLHSGPEEEEQLMGEAVA